MKMDSRQYRKLENAMIPYLGTWEEWIASDYCFLTEEEAVIIATYLQTKNISSVSKKLKLSAFSVRKLIHHNCSKLVFGVPVYNEWIKSRSVDPEYPLNVPVSCLKTKPRLKQLLCQMGDTLAGILEEYTVQDLAKRRGFGKGLVTELQTFLDQYGYAHLLRTGPDKETGAAKEILEDEKSTPAGESRKPVWTKEEHIGVMRPLVQTAGANQRPF